MLSLVRGQPVSELVMFAAPSSILVDAQRDGIAVPHFNFGELFLARTILEVCAEADSPLYLGILAQELDFFGPWLMESLRVLVDESGVIAHLHLDHARSLDQVERGLRWGCTSVMIDGSSLTFEDNVDLTRRVVSMCAADSIPVEAEVGAIGAGDSTDESGESLRLTTVDEAERFIAQTGASSLAVSLGTYHGTYPPGVVIDLQLGLLDQIRSAIDVPLVLHGASGTPDSQVKEAIRHGIAKVNFSRDIKVPYFEAVRGVLSSPDERESFRVFGASTEAVRAVIAKKVEMCRNLT